MEGYKFTAVVAIGLIGNALVELSSKGTQPVSDADYLSLIHEDADNDINQWLVAVGVFTDVPGLYRVEAIGTAFPEDDAPEYQLIAQTPVHYDAGGDL